MVGAFNMVYGGGARCATPCIRTWGWAAMRRDDETKMEMAVHQAMKDQGTKACGGYSTVQITGASGYASCHGSFRDRGR